MIAVDALVFVPLVLLYEGWTCRVFRGRVGGPRIERPGGSPIPTEPLL